MTAALRLGAAMGHEFDHTLFCKRCRMAAKTVYMLRRGFAGGTRLEQWNRAKCPGVDLYRFEWPA